MGSDISFVQYRKHGPQSFRVLGNSFKSICEIVKTHREKLVLLSSHSHFDRAVGSIVLNDLWLDEFNIAALAEVARLLWERINPDHVFWKFKHNEWINELFKSEYLREYALKKYGSLEEWIESDLEDQRCDFVEVVRRIDQVLEYELQKRSSMSPHRRLLEALSFRADKLLPDFMASEGIAPNAVKKMQALIIRNGWPKNLMRYLRLYSHMESFKQDLP